MTSLEPTGPNAEQIRYWNEGAGPRWVAQQAFLDAQIAPLGHAAMDRAALAAGERVLDVGCGCGQTALDLAERVGPGGQVLGVDLSTQMLARARERAAGLPHVRFENADAQTHAFDREHFDCAFSRFGVMFFADPEAAFANLLRALRGGGRLVFVCWQELRKNPWMLVPLGAAAQHVELPKPPEPGAPGPFAFADPARVRGILEAAGFEDVAFDSLERELAVGGAVDLETTVDFLSQLGPAAAALVNATPEQRARARDAMCEALRPYQTEGGVRLSSASWIVSARRPR